MTTPPPMQRQFFFNLFAELQRLAEADMRFNILTRDDGECEELILTGVAKDGKNPVIRVEDLDGDEFFIFMDHIISITPCEASEEGETDVPDEETEEDAEGAAHEEA